MNCIRIIFYRWSGLFFAPLYLLYRNRLLRYDLALLQSAKWGIRFKILKYKHLILNSNELSHNLKGFIIETNE